MATLSRRAPAKLNLFLHLLSKRADGYHEIESLVAFADVADELSFVLDDHLSLTVTGEFASDAGSGEGNLVLKAAKALQQRTGCKLGARISLEKNIPVGGGLGGGSSDAAASLQSLNQLWQLNLSVEELQKIAVTLGADVAMCLEPKPAIVRGIGEVILPLAQKLPTMFAVLVHPRVPLLTKDVYGAFEGIEASAAWDQAQEFWSQLRAVRNHLQRPAVTVNSQVAEVLLALEVVQPAAQLVRMTGSGACCFALYLSQDEASRAAANLAQEYPGWWVRAARIIP